MPPKKQPAAGPSKKTEQKKKEKVIEDKTFGLKNKKGTKQQKFIQHVSHQVKHGAVSMSALKAQQFEEKRANKAKPDDLADLNKLFKPVAEMPKVSKDVDPKSIVCVFFKQGMCKKSAAKCKWSHDLAVERKAEKRNLYVDSRDLEGDTMDNWDDEKLQEVVSKKQGANEANKTNIICKYFIEAVENSKYGWFWECPNGENCIYRHALPPGYVLKKDKKKLDEASKQDQISIEELVEKERAALGSNLTKVTLESFLAWKKRKIVEKKKKASAAANKKQSDFKAGKQVGLSGRDLFTFNPDLVAEDDDDADDVVYEVEKEEDEEGMETHEISDAMFAMVEEGGGAEGGGVQFNEDLFDPDEVDDISDSEEEGEQSSAMTNGVAQIDINS